MVDYIYYTNKYQGSVIDNSSDFTKYENMAVRYVKSIINPQVDYNEEDIYECICVLAEQLFENNDLKNIKSETVDGLSVTYTGDFNKALYETLKLYLPKELLYRGLN